MPIGGPEAPVHCIIDSSGVTIQPHLNYAFRKAVGDRVMVRVMVWVRVWVRVWDRRGGNNGPYCIAVQGCFIFYTESKDDRSIRNFCHLCCL